MENISKAWDWPMVKENYFFLPCEESYYLVNRWKEKGFNKFLDLGCGLGRHSIQFAKDGFDVTGFDLSDEAVKGLNEWAENEKLNIITFKGDMVNLPFGDNTFDCIMAYHVIFHTDSKGIVKILSEIKRVLKEGGELYLTLGSKNSWSYKDSGYPKLDKNTVIKIEDGPENNVPHFYTDDINIYELLKDFELVSLKHTQSLFLNEEKHKSWHYYILVRKQ
jgi:SAM-dependent methyltransferase